MPYGVTWQSTADDDLVRIAAIDPVAASLVLDQLDQLASDPIGLSRPAGFPHPPFQKYQFWAGDLFITIVFQYGQDEQTIDLVGIGIVRKR